MLQSCNFDDDNNPLCEFSQSTSDSAEWTRQRGGTPSEETGPMSDQTTGNGRFDFWDINYKSKA